MTDNDNDIYRLEADNFARNFYLERKVILSDIFNFKQEQRTYVSRKIENLHLNEEMQEKFKHIISVLLTDTFYTILLGLDGEHSFGENQQEFFKIFNEKGNLISNCGELEAAAYDYFCDNKLEIEQSNCDFIAILTYKTTDDGGRKTAARTGYRPQIKFGFTDMETSGQQTFIERELVFPGETVEAEIRLLSPEIFYGKLKYNIKFEFREGDKVIGTGKIKHILNKKLDSDETIATV
jgi:hypothetical protein